MMKMVYHPDDVKHILQENHRNYNKDVYNVNLLKPLLGQGLFTNDGQSWLHQRRLAQPAFHRKRLATFGALITSATEDMLEHWHEPARRQQTMEIGEEMMLLTLRVVGQALFSIDLSDEADIVGQSFSAIRKLLQSYVFRPFPPLGVPTPRNSRLNAAIRSLDGVVQGIIHERRQHDTDTGDLLSMLLLARDEETGEGMSDRQLRDEVMTLLLAGHETTANALAWMWHLLSQHPDIEARLHAELDRILAGTASIFTGILTGEVNPALDAHSPAIAQIGIWFLPLGILPLGVGLLGLFGRLAGRSKGLGIPGVVLAAVGMLLGFGALMVLSGIFGSSDRLNSLFGGFGSFAIIIGSGFLGWAALRAHALPRWMAILLLVMGFVTVPFIFVTPFPFGPPWATDFLGFLLIAIVYIVSGVTLVAARKQVGKDMGESFVSTAVQAK